MSNYVLLVLESLAEVRDSFTLSLLLLSLDITEIKYNCLRRISVERQAAGIFWKGNCTNASEHVYTYLFSVTFKMRFKGQSTNIAVSFSKITAKQPARQQPTKGWPDLQWESSRIPAVNDFQPAVSHFTRCSPVFKLHQFIDSTQLRPWLDNISTCFPTINNSV